MQPLQTYGDLSNLSQCRYLYKFNDEKPYTITRENDIWVIKGKEIEKLFSMLFISSESFVSAFETLITKDLEEGVFRAPAYTLIKHVLCSYRPSAHCRKQ